MATIEQITSDPRFARATPEQKQRLIAKAQDAPTSLKAMFAPVAKQAIKEAAFQPGTISRDLATDPVTQAKALPALAGTAGALSPVPMGATIGTVGGRQLSNAALRSYGRPEEIPSGMQQAIEGVLSVGGDITAFPAMSKARYGKQIGEAEKAAGVVTKGADKYPTSGTVGEVLNTLEGQIDAGAISDPTLAKTAYDITDFIHRNPHIVGKSNNIKVQAYRVGAKAQSLLNHLVSGRGEAAKNLAMSQKVPNLIRDTYKAIPNVVKAGTGAGIAFELTRRGLNAGRQER